MNKALFIKNYLRQKYSPLTMAHEIIHSAKKYSFHNYLLFNLINKF